MPKSYVVFKWVVYTAAILLLLLLNTFLLSHLRLWGVTPLVVPMVVGVVSSFEGSRASPFFALAFGLFWDLATPAGVPGFYTLTCTLSALLSALLAENLFSPGLLCSFVTTTVCYLLTALGRLVSLLTEGSGALAAAVSVAFREYLISLPWLLVVFFVYRWVHRRTTVDY